MISFELSEEQRIAQSTLAEFSKAVLRPQARRLDEAGALDDEILDALWSTGIVQTQAADGGERRSSVLNAIVMEELAVGDASLALALASTMAFVQVISDQGSAQQRAQLLERFAGESYEAAAVLVMEPRFGSEPSAFDTTAVKRGNDYVLSGVKTMVPLASRCGHFLVLAGLDGAREAFVVPASSPGVSISTPKGTLGLRATEMSEVRFQDVVVPAAMRIGEGNGADTQKIVDSARVGLACIMTGLSRGVLEYVIPYVKDRVVHGTPLAQKQKVAFDVADMHIDVEAMRWMCWRAAWELENNQPATRSAQLAYTYAGAQTMTIADNGVQSFGGHGFVRAHPIELWYRNARSLSVLEGVAGV